MDDKERENFNNLESVNNAPNNDANYSNQQANSYNAENTAKKDRKGFSIASLVLGIITLILFCIWYISIPCGILAIIFGILGIKSTGKGMSIAGLITGSIGLLITLLIVIFAFIYGFTVGMQLLDSVDSKDFYNNTSYERNYDLDYDAFYDT